MYMLIILGIRKTSWYYNIDFRYINTFVKKNTISTNSILNIKNQNEFHKEKF